MSEHKDHENIAAELHRSSIAFKVIAKPDNYAFHEKSEENKDNKESCESRMKDGAESLIVSSEKKV